MVDYRKEFKYLSDDDLQYELLKCANDSYLLHSEEEQKAAHYQERHNAVWAELKARGLTN